MCLHVCMAGSAHAAPCSRRLQWSEPLRSLVLTRRLHQASVLQETAGIAGQPAVGRKSPVFTALCCVCWAVESRVHM